MRKIIILVILVLMLSVGVAALTVPTSGDITLLKSELRHNPFSNIDYWAITYNFDGVDYYTTLTRIVDGVDITTLSTSQRTTAIINFLVSTENETGSREDKYKYLITKGYLLKLECTCPHCGDKIYITTAFAKAIRDKDLTYTCPVCGEEIRLADLECLSDGNDYRDYESHKTPTAYSATAEKP